MKSDKLKRYLLFAAVSVVSAVIVYETAMSLILAAPAVFPYLPQGLLKHVRHIYFAADQNVIQLLPGNTHYDQDLTYILTPGKFIFSNREFSNTFVVNSRGLRDDEASLHAPEIIVVGDSMAMGWGVGQEETFPQIIERATGYKVLNAAISSYGTVREMKMLDRLDTKNLKYLIIQYCENDLIENKTFLEQGVLPIKDRPAFEKVVRDYNQRRPYFFGKYALCSLYFLKCSLGQLAKKIYFKTILPHALDLSPSKQEEARVFLNAVWKIPKADLTHVRILVVAIDVFSADERLFLRSLEERKHSAEYPDFIRDLTAIDVSSRLTKGCYYMLDGHPTPKGQAMIAKALLSHIGPK